MIDYDNSDNLPFTPDEFVGMVDRLESDPATVSLRDMQMLISMAIDVARSIRKDRQGQMTEQMDLPGMDVLL